MKRCNLLVVCLLLSLALSFLSFYAVQPAKAFNPDTDIFWEYGAEGGTLGEKPQPPLEHADMMGTGVRDPPSYAHISDDFARTGTKSVKLYQVPPTKSDAQRRVTCREYSDINGQTEMYWSWWEYFPNNMANYQSGIWTNLGGLTMRYGPSSNKHKYISGLSVYFNDGNPRRFYATYIEVFDGTKHYHYSGFYLNSTYLNKWMHLQAYTKLSNSSDGIHRVWIGDGTTTELVLEATGLKNDPRGYSKWNDESLVFAYPPDGFYAKFQLYQPTNSPESWFYVDDAILSTTKVSETYGVGGQSPEFEDFEDGFETGDFSKWNSTEYANGGYEPVVTSTYTYQGSYSANLTIDGTFNSYSRPMHTVSGNPTEIYMRSFVRFEDLPDTNNSVLWLHRIAQSDGTYILASGIQWLNGNYYWIEHHNDATMNNTQRTINADTWYGVQTYLNVTTNGNATVWLTEDNGASTVTVCEMAGDYSAWGSIGRVYPYIYAGGWNGSQQSAKTFYHDNFRCDDNYIGWGTPRIFQIGAFYTSVGETSPLEGVVINGTYQTDASGYYEWGNLDYNTVYTFVVEKPSGYYPAWCLNVEGSFSWNGTHYILSHNVTETQTGYIETYFFPSSEPYVKQISDGLDLIAASYEESIWGNYYYLTTNTTGWFVMRSAAQGETFLAGGSVTSKVYNETDDSTNITLSSATTVELIYETEPSSWWGGWWNPYWGGWWNEWATYTTPPESAYAEELRFFIYEMTLVYGTYEQFAERYPLLGFYLSSENCTPTLAYLIYTEARDELVYIALMNRTVAEFPNSLFVKPEKDLTDVKADFNELFSDLAELIEEGNLQKCGKILDKLEANIQKEIVDSPEKTDVSTLIQTFKDYIYSLTIKENSPVATSNQDGASIIAVFALALIVLGGLTKSFKVS